MIAFILIVNALLIFKLWWDYRAKNVKHRIINHEQSAAIDGVIYIVSAWLLIGFPVAAGWVILAVGYRWVMFDIIFNLLNKWKWNHYGKSSRLDRFLGKMGAWHLAPKTALIVLGIVLIKIL